MFFFSHSNSSLLTLDLIWFVSVLQFVADWVFSLNWMRFWQGSLLRMTILGKLFHQSSNFNYFDWIWSKIMHYEICWIWSTFKHLIFVVGCWNSCTCNHCNLHKLKLFERLTFKGVYLHLFLLSISDHICLTFMIMFVHIWFLFLFWILF
jgi:hypothetical protein